MNEVKHFFTTLYDSYFTDENEKKREAETKYTFDKLVEMNGYSNEDNIVNTCDGYSLMLNHWKHSNPKKKESSNKMKNYSFLLVHGLLDSSDGYVCNSPNNCLPYILLNLNFDVWLLNTRGTKYSKNTETSLHWSNPTFWNFSFHEIGFYDIPAAIAYINNYNVNNNPQVNPKIFLLSHSQACSAILAGICRNNPFYSKYTIGIIFLAPPSRVDATNCSNIIDILNKLNFFETLKTFKQQEVLAYNQTLSSINVLVNSLYPTSQLALLETVSDNCSSSVAIDRWGIYLGHYPNGTSIQSMIHYKQIYDAKQFRAFDYGSKEMNMWKYGTEAPPAYEIDKIQNVKIIICGGLDDKLVNIKDVQWWKEELATSGVWYNYHEFEYMGHWSFLWCNNVFWFNKVWRDVYKIIERYEKENDYVIVKEDFRVNVSVDHDVERSM